MDVVSLVTRPGKGSVLSAGGRCTTVPEKLRYSMICNSRNMSGKLMAGIAVLAF
jgi:hypothetical protein